jgi:hypothetical protein
MRSISFSRQLAFAAVLSLTANVVAAQTAAQTREAVIQQITLRGTVEAIDHTARTVRIRTETGNIVTLDVPTTVTDFDRIRTGDVVNVGYYDRVSIRPKPPGEAAVDRVTETGAAVTGLLPAGARANQRITTVTIDAWDPATRMVTFTTPKGQTYTRRVSETLDPALLAGLSVGDRVDVTRTQAVTLSAAAPAAAAAAAAPAVPLPDDFRHRFTISALWGIDNSFSGNMIDSGAGELQGVPISLDEKTYDDVYGRMGLFKVGIGYRTSPRSEVVVDFVISRSSSDDTIVGTIGEEAAPVSARFDDYNYWGIEAGQRFYFTRVRFTPYVGYFVGINRFDEINADFIAPPVGSQPAVAVENGQFFDSAWAFSFGPRGGVLIGLGPIEVMGEVALRYMGGLSDVDPLSEAGLRDINDESSRWSFPILVGARLRF